MWSVWGYYHRWGKYICKECDEALKIKSRREREIRKMKIEKERMFWKKERDILLKEEWGLLKQKEDVICNVSIVLIYYVKAIV